MNVRRPLDLWWCHANVPLTHARANASHAMMVVPASFDELLARYTHDGYRVLACGAKRLHDLSRSSVSSEKR